MAVPSVIRSLSRLLFPLLFSRLGFRQASAPRAPSPAVVVPRRCSGRCDRRTRGGSRRCSTAHCTRSACDWRGRTDACWREGRERVKVAKARRARTRARRERSGRAMPWVVEGGTAWRSKDAPAHQGAAVRGGIRVSLLCCSLLPLWKCGRLSTFRLRSPMHAACSPEKKASLSSFRRGSISKDVDNLSTSANTPHQGLSTDLFLCLHTSYSLRRIKNWRREEKQHCHSHPKHSELAMNTACR